MTTEEQMIAEQVRLLIIQCDQLAKEIAATDLTRAVLVSNLQKIVQSLRVIGVKFVGSTHRATDQQLKNVLTEVSEDVNR